jgi:hypothetical protein
MPTVENTYKWKVSVIAQYTDSWATEYQLLIDAIKAQLNTPKIHFIIFKYYADQNPKTNCKASITEYFQGATDEEKFLPQLCNLYNPQTLTDFFTRVKTVEADAHILITWGHGAGLGFFEPPSVNHGGGFETPEWARPVNKENPQVLHGHKPPPTIGYKEFLNTAAMLKANLSLSAAAMPGLEEAPLNVNVSIRDQLFEVKDLQSLDDSLVLVTAEQLAGNLSVLDRPVDLFISCNCYCQMFESGLALMGKVTLMVAAETTYPITGFNYDPFFQAIQDDTSLDFVSLSKNVCDNFLAKYEGPDAIPVPVGDANFNFDNVSLSANDLSGYKDLLTVINQLADWQRQEFNIASPAGALYYNYFYGARIRSGDLSIAGCLIDLRQYLDELNTILQQFELTDFKAIYQNFLSVQAKCLKDILPPKKQISRRGPVLNRPPFIVDVIPQFVSVFFPDGLDHASTNELYSRFYMVGATGMPGVQTATTWVDFVREYLAHFQKEPKLGPLSRQITGSTIHLA